MIKILTSFLFVLFLFSCDSMPVSMPVGITGNSSWRVTEKSGSKGTIKLIGVTADRSGGRNSLEQEIAVLAPLCFLGKRYKTVGLRDSADYAVAISIREREFPVGWNTKRSLAVEVRIWHCTDGDILTGETEKVPIAAGRVISIGNASFSSSKITGRMLSRAISAAVRQLSVVQRSYSRSQEGR